MEMAVVSVGPVAGCVCTLHFFYMSTRSFHCCCCCRLHCRTCFPVIVSGVPESADGMWKPCHVSRLRDGLNVNTLSAPAWLCDMLTGTVWIMLFIMHTNVQLEPMEVAA